MLALLISLFAAPPASVGGLSPARIAPDTWVVTDRDYFASNVLVTRMPDGTALIVSSPFEDVGARALLAWIHREVKPTRMVAINPHFHFDGSGGNAVFNQAGVETWSSDRTRELVQSTLAGVKRDTLPGIKDPALRARLAALVPTPARAVFPLKAGKTFDFGGERVEVIFPGESHSPDHVVVWLPRRRLLFGGCMVKPGKSLGFLGHANLKTWADAARRLHELRARIVVPGHGRWGGPELVEKTITNAVDAHPDVEAARTACTGGRWQACLTLVQRGASDGKPLMAAHWRARCKPGATFACDQLGIYTTDEAERRVAQDRACEGGAGMACYSLSLSASATPEQARVWRARACALKQPDACEEIARAKALDAQQNGGQRGCGAGDAAACFAMGEAIRQRGASTGSADWTAAHAAYGQACAKAHGPACTALGTLHHRARGVRRSYETAVRYYAQGCRAKDPAGCAALAERYWYGEGVEEDLERAYHFNGEACRLGSMDGCGAQADALFAGRGVQASAADATALRWSTCQKGHPDACDAIIETVIAETVDAALRAADYRTRTAEDAVARYELGFVFGKVQRRCDRGEAVACSFMKTWQARQARKTAP